MDKDFISVNPDGGNGSATVTVSASANSGAARSTSITISGGGITRTVNISQEKGSMPFIVCGSNGYIDKIEV